MEKKIEDRIETVIIGQFIEIRGFLKLGLPRGWNVLGYEMTAFGGFMV